MKTSLTSSFFRQLTRLFACCLLACGITSRAQNTFFISNGGPPPQVVGAGVAVRSGDGQIAGGSFGLVINGCDIGTIILKACGHDQDGKATLTELKILATNYFKQWDTNADGNLNADELLTGLKAFFPPPPGGAHAFAMINGVGVEVPPDQMPTPDKQLTKHIMAQADVNQDGLLSLPELNDWLEKSFSQWDLNGDGALDASELNAAFGQLAKPD